MSASEHIASFRCAAELGRNRGIADIDQAAPINLDLRARALAAALVLLDRRTGNRTIGAEHAAIAGKRFESFAAAFAVIEELAGVGGHGLNRLMATFRAS